jgi:hypothetical protein
MTFRNLLPLGLAAALAVTCATSPPRKYPPRRPGCALAVFASSTPQIAGGWDDIGIAEASCYLDESEVACMHRLRVEACRMGGDIVYGVPKRAARPLERVMVIRARVAHTIPKPAAQADDVPAATVNQPVVPIGTPIPVRDGGPGGSGTDAAANQARGG